MSQTIENERTVYTLSTSQPLYVYSSYDKLLMEISKDETQAGSKGGGLLDGLKNIAEFKFNFNRWLTESQISQIQADPQSVIVNLDLGDNCLIGAKGDNQQFDGGIAISTSPDPVTGKYFGPTHTGLPNLALNFFANKFGETSVEGLREQMLINEETVGEETPTSQEELAQGQEELKLSQGELAQSTIISNIPQGGVEEINQ